VTRERSTKWRLALGAAALAATGGCSSITNTLSGLTTPQSTISGSNYVYTVDPTTNRVVTGFNAALGADNIVRGDSFTVTMDFGFLRYLQAVDPFVVVYTTCKVGGSPLALRDDQSGAGGDKSPDDGTIHQIVLLKHGLTPNARLPLTNAVLLPPVKLAEADTVVEVAVHVVVLSQESNADTLQILDRVVSVASSSGVTSAAYGPVAKSLGAAIVAQNQDKIEFEHKFTFFPRRAAVSSDDADTAPKTTAGVDGHVSWASEAVLREGRFVVVKGESDYRRVPYEHPADYLWPLNWFGHGTSHESRRFETSSDRPRFEGGMTYVTTPLYYILRLPFTVVTEILSPGVGGHGFGAAGTAPTALVADEHGIVIPEESGTLWDNKNQRYYSEKTHFCFSVRRIDGDCPTFDELRKTDQDTAKLKELLTSPQAAREASTKAIDDLGANLADLVKERRATARALDLAASDKPAIPELGKGLLADFPAVPNDAVKDQANKDAATRLFHTYLERVQSVTLRRFAREARSLYRDVVVTKSADSKPSPDASKVPDFVANLTGYVTTNAWNADVGDAAAVLTEWASDWDAAWRRTVEDLRKAVRAFDPVVRQKDDSAQDAKWKTAKDAVNAADALAKKISDAATKASKPDGGK